MRYFNSKITTDGTGNMIPEIAQRTEKSRLVTNDVNGTSLVTNDVNGTKNVSICGVNRDWIAIAFVVFIKLGDAIEIYLPGVISQHVSCDLGISQTQEGILAISMYVFEFLAIVVSYFFAERFGRKPVLLFSFYMCNAHCALS